MDMLFSLKSSREHCLSLPYKWNIQPSLMPKLQSGIVKSQIQTSANMSIKAFRLCTSLGLYVDIL